MGTTATFAVARLLRLISMGLNAADFATFIQRFPTPQGIRVFNDNIRKTISLMALTCAAGFSIWALALPLTARIATQDHQNATLDSEETGTTWRYTKNGWQDIGGMYRDTFVAIKSFELVHPLIWAASVLLAVIGTSIWASNEWEIAQLLNQNSDGPDAARSESKSECVPAEPTR